MSQLALEKHPLYELNPPLTEGGFLLSPVSVDIETTGLEPWNSKIRLIALRSGESTWLIQPEYYPKQVLTDFLLEVAKHKVILHNAKFDLGFIYYHYGVLFDNVFCTMLASQVFKGGIKPFSHSLDNCLKTYLGVDVYGGEKKELQKSFGVDSPLTEEQLAYAAKDVSYLVPLMEYLVANTADLVKIVALENKLAPILAKVETHGCLIDVAAWKLKLAEWELKRKEYLLKLDDEFIKLSPMVLFANLNYSSPKQVIAFFKRFGDAPKKEEDGKTRESVDEDSLNNYLNEHPDSELGTFVKHLLQYREYDKLLTTYGEAFLEKLDKNNYIHTSYKQCATATGRLSSSSPNLQNIPSDKSGEGGVIRNYFIAPEGYKLITCDMTGAELAIAADLSGEPLLIDAILHGADMHSQLASISFSIIYGKPVTISKSKEPLKINDTITIIPGEARDIHKSVTFSKLYKGGPKRIYQVLARYINPAVAPNKRMATCKRISEALDRAMPKLSRFLTATIDKANAQGYLITTNLGRKRIFNGSVYGEAANAPVQSRNADAMKIAMVNIDRYLSEKGYGQIILTVHDEVVVQVEDSYAEEVAQVVKAEMAKALSFHLTQLKGEASVKVGKRWEK